MNYRYTGPASGLTLADGKEVLLWPNQQVDLPEKSPAVQTLVAQGYLILVAVPAAAPVPKKKGA
ncbi:MAG: hypothetical protein LBL69_03720 [Zoogloeaceae bacterium]|jgi:hypothetical protein|nr:hypothetical protein [Zoogloeaceae bacterium]